MLHSFEPVPYDAEGRELPCLLDGPAHHFLVGCMCGWRGPEIPLPVDRHFTLPDAVYEEVEQVWEALHYVDAVLAEREELDATIDLTDMTSPVGSLDMSEFERLLSAP